MTFADRFDEVCRLRGTSPSAVAMKAGKSNATYSYWKKKGSVPSAGDIKIMADVLGISIEELWPTGGYQRGSADELMRRPIVGSVSAGMGVIAQQDVIGYEFVENKYAREDCFWLKVHGDSMAPLLSEGDLVLVDKAQIVEQGCVCVAIIDGEGYVKRAEFSAQSIVLRSENPYYPPIRFKGKDCEKVLFVGRVVKQQREL